MAAGKRLAHHVEQVAYLAVDDHGVEAFLAAEVLVDDRLRHLGATGDLLDRGAVETPLGEQGTGDLDELITPLGGGHPMSRRPSAPTAVGGLGHARHSASPPRQLAQSTRCAQVVVGAVTRLASIRSLTGHRTSWTQPSFSSAQMIRAEVSIWPRSTPCRAQVGSAWCRLCHDSPIDGIASHQTLPDLSRLLKGRLPTVWQIELIDQVTWWSIATRTRLAQKNAVRAPCHDIVHSPPAIGGMRSDTAVHSGNCREIRTRSRSFSRSGA